MTHRICFLVLIAFSFVNVINAECANACNGHGKCTSYDMCLCHRNWQASDCSERVCQFGLAHVDSPKGDLNMDGSVEDADHPTVENSFVYPYGTTEQFPAMQNSDQTTLINTAHYYMECSNKGTCDRTSGECTCYDGFDGAACQRASCPNSCSGHGVCKSIESLANSDSKNVYKLWDRASTYGCKCDAGYGGADCANTLCKHGIDPLYYDDSTTVKYSIYNFATMTTDTTLGGTADADAGDPFTDGTLVGGLHSGKWAIRFYDIHGEDWLTQPIPSGASCSVIVKALEALPNNVIPPGVTSCTQASTLGTGVDGLNAAFGGTPSEADYSTPAYDSHHIRPIVVRTAFWDEVFPETFAAAIKAGVQGITGVVAGFPSSYDSQAAIPLQGYIYRIKFYGNPGQLKQPKIEIYLDGKRPSMVNVGYPVITKVWTDGQQGESKDYFADHCNGVTATIATGDLTGAYAKQDISYSYLVLTAAETLLLKACLGSSDDNPANNVDVYNWDYGSQAFPHLVKLVRSTTTYTDGGYYVALYYDGTLFRLVNPFKSLDNDIASGTNNNFAETDQYEIYTTTGTLALTDPTNVATNEAIFGFASQEIIMTKVVATAATALATPITSGSVACEVYTAADIYCLNKTDIFTVLNWGFPNLNPANINLYKVNKIYTKQADYSLVDLFGATTSGVASAVTATTFASTGINKITTDISTNWASSLVGKGGIAGTPTANHPKFQIYKFTPNPISTYEYVAECSNRGLCDYTAGTCTCFPGYSSDACQEQNSLAV